MDVDEKKAYFHYDCNRPYIKGGDKCPGCSISINLLDSAVAEYIIELIRDPSIVDKKIQQFLAENSASKQQQRMLKNLNTILSEQETFRKNLGTYPREFSTAKKRWPKLSKITCAESSPTRCQSTQCTTKGCRNCSIP